MADWTYKLDLPQDRSFSGGPREIHVSTVEGHEVKYPYNQMMKYESGHIMEFNNTPGSEYVRIAHRTGSEIIMDKDGNITINSGGKRFNPSTWETGDPSDITINASADVNIVAEGAISVEAGGDMTVNVAGDLEYNIGGEIVYNLNNEIIMNSHLVVQSADIEDVGTIEGIEIVVEDDLDEYALFEREDGTTVSYTEPDAGTRLV